VVEHTQEEGQACLESLEDPGIIAKDVKEKELLCTAMASYYLLYR
jgi:hypothetical protein